MTTHLKNPLLTASICMLSASSFAAERLALVIGNSQYSSPEFGVLPNPHYDATRIADRLRKLGFEVILREDLTRRELGKAFSVFSKKISQNTEIALLFYAGHGIEIAGKSYLIPTDIKLEHNPNYPLDEQYSNGGMETRYLIEKIAQAGAQTNIMIFDACRTLPGRASHNTFYIPNKHPHSSLLIAYSAQSGQRADDGSPGENSPYTRALLKYLGAPNLSILDTFNYANSEVNGNSQMAEITFTAIPRIVLNPSSSTANVSAPVFQPPIRPPVHPNDWIKNIWVWAGGLFTLAALVIWKRKRSAIPAQSTVPSGIHFDANSKTPTESAAASRVNSNKNNVDSNDWSKKIWAWADEFKIPKEKLPRNKKELLALKKLSITGYSNLNKITYLPPEIGQLSNLQELCLNHNQLQTLPAEMEQLSNLQMLNLEYNRLQSLPVEIGQLRNLQWLNLYNNQLQTLPSEIGQLNNLQELWLNHNQLQTLPPEMGQLSNLKNLQLHNNQLQTLLPEMGQLRNLQYLSLSDNQLQTLPAEMGQLRNLQELYLNYNQLQTLPVEMGQLRNLQILWITNNKLQSLPESFIFLKNLCSLKMYNNLLLNLTTEQEQFIDEIDSFFC